MITTKADDVFLAAQCPVFKAPRVAGSAKLVVWRAPGGAGSSKLVVRRSVYREAVTLHASRMDKACILIRGDMALPVTSNGDVRKH